MILKAALVTILDRERLRKITKTVSQTGRLLSLASKIKQECQPLNCDATRSCCKLQAVLLIGY
jgi:hypothetical protein